jgi:ABC-type branched-subunit amino acid transport system ATPase component
MTAPALLETRGVSPRFGGLLANNDIKSFEWSLARSCARGVRAARERAFEVLDFTGLELRAEMLASELTPAEKRRLEIARALATSPKLLLLDEVLTGLTPAAIVLDLGGVLAQGEPADIVRNPAVL